MIENIFLADMDFDKYQSPRQRVDRINGFLSRHGYLKYVDGTLPDVPRIHINSKDRIPLTLNIKEMNKSINRVYRLNILNAGINRSRKGIYLSGDQDTLICLDKILHWIGSKENPKLQEINKLKIVIVVHYDNNETIYLKY